MCGAGHTTEFVAPMPEQIETTTIHFFVDSGEPHWPPNTSGKCIVYGLNLFWHGCYDFHILDPLMPVRLEGL